MFRNANTHAKALLVRVTSTDVSRARARRGSLARAMSHLLATCAVCAAAYFAWVLSVVAPHAPRLFAPRFGRGHRLAGAAHLLLLLVGVADLLARASRASFGHGARPPLELVSLPLGRAGEVSGAFLYDVLLGVSGCALTATAALDFGIPRARLRNRASGALDDDQTVTKEEIVEHLFYQILNLTQAVFLRVTPNAVSAFGRKGACAALALATAPWLSRAAFPVNRFSDNYRNDAGTSSTSRRSVRALYRMKKTQYVFLKHVLQHGLNVGVVLRACAREENGTNERGGFANETFFRAHWLLLNAAFVMEFFAQTLVKKKKLSQKNMLRSNAALMATSSVAAVYVISRTSLVASVTSLTLNLVSPAREARSVAIALAAAVAVDGTWPAGWIAFLLFCVAPACALVEKHARAWGKRHEVEKCF